jgi:hypothetical protein
MMHLILLIVRLLLNLIGPTDGVSLAARSDGRVQQVPAGPHSWEAWLGRMGRNLARGASFALGLRAEHPRTRDKAKRSKNRPPVQRSGPSR